MKLLSKLARYSACLIFSKHHRLLYKDYLCYIDSKKDIESAQKNYENIIARLKNKPTNEKIRVVFLLREPQKWTYQSVYEEFEKSERFEPLVLVSILTIVNKGKDKTRNNLEDSYNFFKSKNMNVDYAYKNGEYVDLKEFAPDIVFYDQPWDLPRIHEPAYVSDFALTCYCSYSFELVDNCEHYMSKFHRFMYRYFVDNESNIKRYESYLKGNSDNCVMVGYPKLDEYKTPSASNHVWKNDNKYKIIYAPHHSFEKNGIHFATFMKSGEMILELAKQHPETEWVFKPHPRFKYALLRNRLMNESQIKAYFDQWAKIGSVYDKGDYFDIFKTSDLMITDSVSFLAEYLPSKRPIIRLLNDRSDKLNEIGAMINEGVYSVRNNDELQKVFKELVVNKNDSKKMQRENLIPAIWDSESSAKRIYQNISLSIGVENE